MDTRSALDISDAVRQRSQTVRARESRKKPRAGWRYANAARRRHGRRTAVAMLMARLNRASGQTIADVFGVSRGAVYVRLHRLRRGQYD